jgi:hypothetical protein
MADHHACCCSRCIAAAHRSGRLLAPHRISKHRRTVRDYEQLPASHEAMITWAMIALMTRRLAQPDD